jgi:hypothetical protein
MTTVPQNPSGSPSANFPNPANFADDYASAANRFNYGSAMGYGDEADFKDRFGFPGASVPNPASSAIERAIGPQFSTGEPPSYYDTQQFDPNSLTPAFAAGDGSYASFADRFNTGSAMGYGSFDYDKAIEELQKTLGIIDTATGRNQQPLPNQDYYMQQQPPPSPAAPDYSQFTPAQQAYAQQHQERYGKPVDPSYFTSGGYEQDYGVAGRYNTPPPAPAPSGNTLTQADQAAAPGAIPSYALPYHTGDPAHTPWLPGQQGWLSEGQYWYPDFGPNIPQQTWTSYPAQSPVPGAPSPGAGPFNPNPGQAYPYLNPTTGIPTMTPSPLANPSYVPSYGGQGGYPGDPGYNPSPGVIPNYGPNITITPIGG